LELKHLLDCHFDGNLLNEMLKSLPIKKVDMYTGATVYQSTESLSVSQKKEIDDFVNRGCALTPLGPKARQSIKSAVIQQLDVGYRPATRQTVAAVP
jgi:hypothetical protein